MVRSRTWRIGLATSLMGVADADIGIGAVGAGSGRATSAPGDSRWWRLRRGFTASSRAVPSSVVPSTTHTIAKPGERSAHHAPALIAPRSKAKLSIWPQLMRVGSPRPRKARLDSSRIAMLTTSTMLASISGSTAGRMWWRRTWASLAPTALARRTYLRSRTERVCARTSLAVPVQPRMPITRMIVRSDGPRIATRTIMSARSGMTRKTSVIRISSEPIQPR